MVWIKISFFIRWFAHYWMYESFHLSTVLKCWSEVRVTFQHGHTFQTKYLHVSMGVHIQRRLTTFQINSLFITAVDFTWRHSSPRNSHVLSLGFVDLSDISDILVMKWDTNGDRFYLSVKTNRIDISNPSCDMWVYFKEFNSHYFPPSQTWECTVHITVHKIYLGTLLILLRPRV